jgi:hypothetical protein
MLLFHAHESVFLYGIKFSLGNYVYEYFIAPLWYEVDVTDHVKSSFKAACKYLMPGVSLFKI